MLIGDWFLLNCRNVPNVPQLMLGEQKLWYIHKMKYYSATNRNKVQMQAAAWVKLESLMLMVDKVRIPRARKPTGAESRLVVVGAVGGKSGE